MPQNHPALEPFQLGTLTLRNRAVVAPMSRVSTDGNGVPTSNMAEYYAEFADGGFGLIVTEGTYTDNAYAQGYANQPGIVNAAQEDGWRRVVRAVRFSGTRIILQLMHAGALSQCLDVTAAPSRVLPKRKKMPEYGGEGPFPVPKAMDARDIATAIDGFVAAAERAKRAGFDGVEIHGANGYLIDQFITDYTNHRDDEYGGDVSARMRFAIDIVTCVRRAVGGRFVVGLRLSQGKVNDFDYRWPGGAADARVIFRAAADAGADYIHFASEGRGWKHSAVLPDGTSLTRLARRITDLPVIANGGMHDPELARLILEQGQGDLLALGTGALANPDWPNSVAAGHKLVHFDHAMLSPTATIENAWRFKRALARGRRLDRRRMCKGCPLLALSGHLSRL